MLTLSDKNRIDRQKHIIEDLQKQIDELKDENEKLKKLNRGILEKYSLTEEAYKEYTKMIDELKILKFKYYNAYRDAIEMKKNYENKFADHVKQIKRQTMKG